MAAPGPVPALPDTERRTHYAITASVGPLDVGFALYGDGTDYPNWLKVYVNNVETTSYTLSSPSGALGAIARPITDAQVTFLIAQTGTIQIVGARRPRRVSQFTENQGVAARDQNQALNDIEAQNREFWDMKARIIQGVPGDAFPVLIPATRAGTIIGFDGAGNLALYTTAAGATPVVSLTNGLIFDTRGLAALATIPVTTTFIETAGYSAVGDLGAAIYIKIGGTAPGAFQSADGQWWGLAENPVNACQFGLNIAAAAATNRAALQAASDYLNALNGGTCWIPAGTYTIDNAVNVAARVTFRGMGAGTNISLANLTSHAFDLQGGYCRILDMQITAPTAKTGGAGVNASPGTGEFIIDGVYMNAMWDGVRINASLGWTVSNSRITAVQNVGIRISGGSDIMQVFNVVVTAPGALGAGGRAGIEHTGSAGDLTVSGNCQFVGTSYGVLLAPTTADIASCRFSQMLCDQNAIGLYITPNGGAASVSRCTFSQCDFTSSFLAGIMLETTAGARVDDMSFNQCHVNFNGANGVTIADTGVVNVRFTNCLVANNNPNGISIAANVGKVKLIGNIIGAGGSITGNASSGVLIAAGTGDYITVIHNNLLGNAAAITNGATGIHNTVTPNDV